jgi:hypothetical protein
LFHGVVRVLWTEELVTLTRAVSYSGTKEELILESVAGMLSLVAEERLLDLDTESEWLAEEIEKMRGRIAADFNGDMPWEEVPPQWKKVLKYVANGAQIRGIRITLKQEQIPSYQDIMALYMAEVIEKAEGIDLDATSDEAPWF